MASRSEPHSEPVPSSWWERHRETASSVASSFAVHLVLLLILALIVIPLPRPDLSGLLTLTTEVPGNPELERLDHFEISPQENHVPANDVAKALVVTEVVSQQPSALTINARQEELELELEASALVGTIAKLGDLGGRSAKARAALTRAFGGTLASEAAVAEGLEWLKRHQNPDGSWSFDHLHTDCDETCTEPGNLKSATVGATAMAMLCYVGAGHTHLEGTYQPQVKKGLEFLKSQAAKAPEPGDLRQITSGNSGMYTQGLVTILLCELYGLTKDKEVRQGAQDCVLFVAAAQHPKTGGWRYRPGDEQGDTSVVGWQVMALTSAKMADLAVPRRTRERADRFLDSVQLEQGAYYGYTEPQKRPSTTAIGLLCRMYMGWRTDRQPLQAGVRYLSQLGPARDDMYYNYYATQVLHHWGGDEWKRWNENMRDWLVETQVKSGHGKGSWAPRDRHGRDGGRHYMTCLAIMTLEVYYRHLPLYQKRSTEFE